MGNKKLKWQKFFSFFDNAYLIAVVLCLAVFLCLVSMAFVFTYKNVRQSSTKAMVEELELYTDEIGTALHEAELQLTKLAAEPQLVDFLENEPASPSELAEKIMWQTNVIKTALPVIDTIEYFTKAGEPIIPETGAGEASLLKDIVSWMFLNTMSDGQPLFLTLPDNASNISYFIVPVLSQNEICGFIVSKTSRVYLQLS